MWLQICYFSLNTTNLLRNELKNDLFIEKRGIITFGKSAIAAVVHNFKIYIIRLVCLRDLGAI